MTYSGNIIDPFIWVNYSSGNLSKAKAKSDILNTLMETYNFSIRRDTVIREVYLLKASENPRLSAKNTYEEPGVLNKHWIEPDSTFYGDNQETKFIARCLEDRYKVIVFDETGITGEYDWKIDNVPFDKIGELLSEKYGLYLEKAMRPVEMSVVYFK